ncbi:MAG: LCP family protein [Erysipelotrichaceae bacterium]|nr:LCP family protein [Erysipelotrichaceae bacterium]
MRLFDNKILRIIVFMIQIVTSILLVGTAYWIAIFPDNYLMIASAILVILAIISALLIFHKKERSKRSLFMQIISILLSCAMLIGSFYIYKWGEAVDLMTSGEFQTRAMSIVVLEDSAIKNENMISSHQLGYVSSVNTENMYTAITTINKEISNVSYSGYSDFETIIEDFYNGEFDGLLLDESFRSLVEDYQSTFSDDTRVVYQITLEEDSVSANSVDVTTNPFLVYISGNDEYGDISSASRSDVNMLVAVNPNTHQILLISIPRDTYYPLHMNGEYDKFTHSGLYGIQESINTLEDIILEDINYYVKLNFTSFINVVDALGGITVNSPTAFTTYIGGYEIVEGENTLDAKQALAFVRERKAFADGDLARNRNQQRMISAILKKICSPSILVSYTSVLDAVSGSIETNMTTDEINSLVQLELSELITWDIQSYQIVGDSTMMPCYSSGGLNASVIIAYESSIEQATAYIDQIMAGEIIETDTGDLDQ